MGLFGRIKRLFSRTKDEPIHSFVLLRSSPKLIDSETLEQIVSRALGMKFGNADEDDPEASFVVGEPPILMVKVGQAMVLVNCLPSPYISNPEKLARQIPDLRMRKAVAEHRAWISVDWMGDRDEEALSGGYRIIGKIAAELVDHETVAAFAPSTSQLIPIDEEVVDALRSDDPIAIFSEMIQPPVVNISGDDPRMKDAVAEARRRWPEFVRAFESQDGENFAVKAPISDSRNTEFIWITVTEIEGDNITGDLGNDPVELQFMKLGSRVRTTLDQLNDWGFIRDGEMIGGFTVKVLEEASKRR